MFAPPPPAVELIIACSGLDVRYVGSQWLAMPPSAARWLVEDKSLVPQYREYAKHIVVADENFMPTVIKNSPLCANLVSSNLVHVQVRICCCCLYPVCCVCTYVCMYVFRAFHCLCVGTYVCRYAWLYVCMYVGMYVCM